MNLTKSTRSYVHRGGSEPLCSITVDEFISNVIREHGDAEALVSLTQDVRLTYAQLDERVQELARGLLALGVERGSRVAVWSTNNVEWVLLQLATARVGAILVNINPAYRIGELQHALRLAEVQHLFLIPSFRRSQYLEMVLSLCPELTTYTPDAVSVENLPHLRYVVVYDPEDPDLATPPERGILTWTDVLERGRTITEERVEQRRAELDADDPINVQFTSGTTGAPKAVVLTHHSIVNNAFSCGEAMSFTTRDRLCVPVPFYHCFGMVVANLACLTHGAAIVIPSPHFDADTTLKAIEQERCTAVHGVPSMFLLELDHEDFDSFDLSSLRTGVMGGAPCPPALVERVMEEMGCREILVAYGQTETSPLTNVTPPDSSIEHRTETVGYNLPHQELKVVDPDTGAIVPRGVPGEICFRGYHVMRGYYRQDDMTREVIDEAGWLHSGDVGVLDDDGALRITGRIKDMIIRGGENVYPAELESLYHQHPLIAQVAVFGIPDERLGEEVAAWIKLQPGAAISVDELKQFARDRLAHYKVPRTIWFVDDFPMTVTGKIQKFRVREIATRWIEEGVNAPAATAT
ncbi:MAG: AMP-binding protein [Planctomycetes bacterium]|nr:AMP-binding protein [Planctomycetota bacterium]